MSEQGIGQSQDDSAEFDQCLSGALRRVDPPGGFADRVINQVVVAARAPGLFGLSFGWQWRRALATAAIGLLVLAAWSAYRVRERRKQEQVARIESQFETAIAVTTRTLDRARLQLDRPRLWQRFSSASQNIKPK